MTRMRSIAFVCVLLASACGPRRLAAPPTGAGDLIVLLPDADGGAVGAASVSNRLGSEDLERERAATRVVSGGAPAPASIMDDAQVQAIFGDALSALPIPPQFFVLQFRFETDELTEESRALLPEVLKAIAGRPAPEVAVVGHTDTTGDARSNIALGMDRANAVRSLLIGVGLDPSLIEVESHGEADLLVRTPDETREPRNRRVEISVR
jgi:outer membrane protein OmpA-like peptidoglycan-associated protein